MDSYSAAFCDEAYRRGFDQALAFVMQDCGLTQSQITQFRYKEKIAKWRSEARGFTPRLREDPPRMSQDEAKQFVSYLNSAFWNKQGGISDA